MRSSQAERRTSPNRRSSRIASLLAVGAALALPVVLLASFHNQSHAAGQAGAGASSGPKAGAPHLRPGTIIEPSRTSASWDVTYPIHLPSSYQAPTGMAADPDGTGVWFFAQGGTSAHPLDTVFYWSGSTGRLGRYQLHAANPGLQGGAQTPIAVDAAGTAWIGDNKTLISVNRKTGAISSLALPNVSLAGANAPGLPSPPSVKFAQDFTDIDAVAIAPDGSVIVARQYATELQEIDPASRTFSSLPLPKHTELASLGADVAGQGRGEIAAALYAGGGVHELGQYSRGAWHVTQRPCAAYAVAMTATAIAVTGPACVATGSVPRSGRVATLASQPASAAAGSGDQACAIPLPAGLLAMCSRAGVEMAPAGTTPGLTLSLGKIIGAPPVQPDGQPAGNAKSGLVAWTITPGLMAPAANGALWFVPAQGGTMIGLVSRGAAS